jgi:hypothetical protein
MSQSLGQIYFGGLNTYKVIYQKRRNILFVNSYVESKYNNSHSTFNISAFEKINDTLI